MTVAIEIGKILVLYVVLCRYISSLQKWSNVGSKNWQRIQLAYFQVFSKSPMDSKHLRDWKPIVPRTVFQTVASAIPSVCNVLVTVFLMPTSSDKFVEACKAAVRANEEPKSHHMGRWNPLSPSLTNWCWESIGGKTCRGSHFSLSLPCQLAATKSGLVPTNFLIQDEFDHRAAPEWYRVAKVGETQLVVSLPGKMADHANFQMLST